MDTVKKSESLYDYVIVGASLSGLGASLALDEQGKHYCFISQDNDKKTLYPNNQLITTEELGGASNYWHGVIPLGIDNSHEFKKIFLKFYDEKSYKEHLQLFIPKSPIRTKKHLDNGKVVLGTAKLISENKKKNIILHLSDGREVHTKKIILAGGVRATYTLLKDSKLINKDDVTIDDHVCGYAGMINKKKLERVFKISLKPVHTKRGYSIGCFHDEKNQILYTFRPAMFEMKQERNQLRGGPIYGSTGKIKTIINILKEAKIGRLLEALALKTGLWFYPKYFSVHFQAAHSKLHYIKKDEWKVKIDYDHLLQRIAVSAESKGLTLSSKFSEQKLYFGNHLFNLSKTNIDKHVWDKIIIVDASETEDAGATHHSFRQLVKAYKALNKQ